MLDIDSLDSNNKNCICLNCGKKLLSRSQKKFCSNSCSAKYNNAKRKLTSETKDKISKSLTKNKNEWKASNENKICPVCGKKIRKRANTYCSNKCFQEYRHNEALNDWKNNPENYSSETISNSIRRYLFDKYDSKCQKCGWSEINEYSGKIPLEVHHIDGDCTNNKEENLELLCPNCHSLTPNNGSLNECSKRYKLKKYKNLINHPI